VLDIKLPQISWNAPARILWDILSEGLTPVENYSEEEDEHSNFGLSSGWETYYLYLKLDPEAPRSYAYRFSADNPRTAEPHLILFGILSSGLESTFV
jgi:hypothetical protein